MRNVNYVPPMHQQMQEPIEKVVLNGSSLKVISNQPTISRGLLSPYHQQTTNINHMLQSEMTIELWTQLKNLEEKVSLCIKVKDNVIEDGIRKRMEMESRLSKALAEVDYWKTMNDKKTALCKDLAGKLLKSRRKEMCDKMNGEEDAESSTGDNVEAGRTRKCKRRRV